MFGLCRCSDISIKLDSILGLATVISNRVVSIEKKAAKLDKLDKLDKIDKIEARLINLEKKIQFYLFSQFKPNNFPVVLINERTENMISLLKYSAKLPVVPELTDVVSQKFEVVVDGVATVQELAVGVDVAEFEVSQNSNVDLSLSYVDDAGNVSSKVTQSFVALDTIAPDAPGAFGEITLIGERQVEETEETEETPVVEPTE